MTEKVCIFFYDLPAITVDGDFFDYLHSWSYDDTCDVAELAELWDMWVVDND